MIRWSVTSLKRMESFCVKIAENLGYNEINSFVTNKVEQWYVRHN